MSKSKKSRPIVYLEVATKQKKFGKILIELYDDIVPRTVNNFMTLCTNKKTKNKQSYLGCNLHRIIPGFCIQGGDYEYGDGTGGSSIYGKYFEDESFAL